MLKVKIVSAIFLISYDANMWPFEVSVTYLCSSLLDEYSLIGPVLLFDFMLYSLQSCSQGGVGLLQTMLNHLLLLSSFLLTLLFCLLSPQRFPFHIPAVFILYPLFLLLLLLLRFPLVLLLSPPLLFLPPPVLLLLCLPSSQQVNGKASDGGARRFDRVW